MQPCGGVPWIWNRWSPELIDAWLEDTGSVNIDTVPDAVAGFVLIICLPIDWFVA